MALWRTLDTSSLARLFPFSPPDMDTRSGTLYGLDLRARAPIVYDPWDGTHLNANTAVLARSGSGKSFATKLGVLRSLCRGITAYVIDPEGEYADMARAAGGRVLSPGVPGQGMNPFVMDQRDSEELLQRIGSLRRLIEVMVGEKLGAERRADLDHALAGYYAEPRERSGFRDFYGYLQSGENDDPELGSGQALARLLRPFATGSLRHLLSDEGDDLLHNEALVTVFDLRLLEPELRPAAAMVCTETVWASAARTPSLGFWLWTRCGRSCSTPRELRLWSPWPRGPASTGWDSSSSPRMCRISSVRTPPAPSPATLEGAAAERRLQAAAPAGRRRHLHGGRGLRPAPGASEMASLLPQGRRAAPGQGKPVPGPH